MIMASTLGFGCCEYQVEVDTSTCLLSVNRGCQKTRCCADKAVYNLFKMQSEQEEKEEHMLYNLLGSVPNLDSECCLLGSNF